MCFQPAENVVADIILAVIPVTFLSRLKSNIRRRISLSILLGLGSMFVCFSYSALIVLSILTVLLA
jgi:hypothetical protein